jgi:hypothetical protein
VRRATIEVVAGQRLHQRQAACGLRLRIAVRNHGVEPLAEDVLEIVERNGERTAVRGSHLL